MKELEELKKKICQLEEENAILKKALNKKVSEEQLFNNSEKKFKSLFENAPLGAFKSDSEGNLIEINNAFYKLFGYESKVDVLKSISNIEKDIYVNSIDRENIIAKVIDKPGVHIFEVDLKRKDKSVFLGRVLMSHSKTVDNNYFLEGHVEDITESNKIYKALLRSEEKFSLFANNINDIFWIVSSDKKLLFINKAFEKIFDRKVEEFIKNPKVIISWTYPEDRKILLKLSENKKYEQQPINITCRIIRPNKQVRWIWGRTFPVYDSNGKLFRVVGMMSDITEQKLLENALLRSSKKLMLLIEQIPLAYIEWNKKFVIVSWNLAAEKIFGYSKEEAIGSNIIDLIVPSYKKNYFSNLLKDLITQNGSSKTINENIDKNGNILHCEWYNTVLIDNEAKVSIMASIIQDTTEKINAEDNLIKSENFLNATFNSISDFIHVVNRKLEIVYINDAFRNIFIKNNINVPKSGDLLKDAIPFLKDKVLREYVKVFDTGKELATSESTKIKGNIYYTETRKYPVFEDEYVSYIVTSIRDVSENVNTQKLLQESEKRLQLAFDVANDGLWDINPKTKEVNYFSQYWFIMLGYHPQEFSHTFETLLKLIHPEDKPGVEKLFDDYFNENAEFYNIEFRMLSKSGSYKWILARGENVEYDIKGTPIRMVGTHVDITQQKEMEQFIIAKENQLRTLIQHSQDSIIVLSKTGNIKFATKFESEIIGKSITEILGINYLNFIFPDDKLLFENCLKSVISNPDKIEKIEYRCSYPNKTIVYLEGIISNHLNTSAIDGIVVNVRNITEKKQGERNQKVLRNTAIELLETRDFESVFGKIADKILEIIPQTIIHVSLFDRDVKHYTNHFLFGFEIFQKKFNEIINIDIKDFYLQSFSEWKGVLSTHKLIEIEGGIREIMSTQIPNSAYIQIENLIDINNVYVIGLTRNKVLFGAVVFITTNGNEIKYPEVIEALISQVSIAYERILLELELIKSKEKAEESDRLKSVFLTNISHEIRTPMNAILGFAELLKTSTEEHTKKSYIDIIHKNGEHLLRLINDIVDISKIETGLLKVIETNTDLNTLLDNVIEIHKAELISRKKKHIELILKKSLSNEQAIIFTDDTRIKQVLYNLISNAIKFTSKGSIEFGYQLVDDYLQFYVLDTGEGIPTHLKDIIFDRFRQGDEEFSRIYSGAGIGLAICKGIINNMKGKIWAESDGVSGSEFYFTVPYNPVNSGKYYGYDSMSQHKQFDWNGKSVLIVEDDEGSILFLKSVLNKTNIKIFTAEDGIKALEVFKNHTEIDIILLDIKLPLMDGRQVCREIRKINKQVPIIAQTAYAMPGDEKMILKEGCNDYIAKPIKINVLKPLMQYYLNL